MDGPELLQRLQRRVDVAPVTGLDHRLDLDRMRAVDDLEDVVAADETRTLVRALQIVDRLSHVPFGREDQGGDAVVRILHLLGLDDLHEPLDHLGVREAGVAQDGAP